MREFPFLMYTIADSNITINAILKDETIWLSQKGMAELFGVEIPAISKHLTNIFAEGELSEVATVSKIEIVQIEGKRQVKRQIRQLERTVTGYFDYIEDLIERENTFTMEEFTSSVNEFLSFRRYEVLPDNNRGKISRQEALEKANKEYDIFNKTQIIHSDFDELVSKVIKEEME